MKKTSFLYDETGQAIILVVMILLLLFLLSTAAVAAAVESRRAYSVEKTMIQANYLAESGVERALAKAREDSEWLADVLSRPSSEVVLIAGEQCSGGIISQVTIKGESIGPATANIIITSVGLYENSKKTLVVKAQIKPPLNFSSAVWANYSETEPGVWEPSGEKPAPEMKKDFCEKYYHSIHEGNLYISDGFSAERLYYVTGNLYLSGHYSGAGAIVAGGGVYITGDLLRSAEKTDSLLIAALGPEGVTVTMGASVDGLLYASPDRSASGGGLICLEDGAQINGGIICDRLSANPLAGTEVQYDAALAANQPGWVTTGITITSWEELYPVF